MRILFTWFFFLGLLLPVMGQNRESAKELFDDGQYFMRRQDFKEAAYYFKQLINRAPENANFNFKLGECYMNIPGSEALAVPCFEKAIRHIVPKKKYRKNSFDETNAPLHAYFYLGNVYRICDRLGDAMKVYRIFTDSPFYEDNYNQEIVQNEIESCERAKAIQDSPIAVVKTRLDSVINTPADEIDPVVSNDENTLVFVRRLKFYDAILITHRVGDSWSHPENLNPVIGSDGDLYPTCLSADGREMYLVKKGLNSDLWVTFRKDSVWTKAIPLNDAINTKADETSAWISDDGKTLYFSSNRKRGYGGTDIYVSKRTENNQWGKPKNLGPVINTPFDEETPCLTANDSLLFFSSKGHAGMGGYDIFYSLLGNNQWGKPTNLGYPVNTTGDNAGFIAIKRGKVGYFSGISPEDPGPGFDIFRVAIR